MFFPILKKTEVVSHPVRAWREGKIWHVILESELHKSWTGIYLLPSSPPDTVPMYSHSSSVCCIFKEEGSLAPEFDIETSSGAGYSSSEMVMSLICLPKMSAAACKIWLSSHIWVTLLKSWTVVECMSAFMRVTAPIASEVEMPLL